MPQDKEQTYQEILENAAGVQTAGVGQTDLALAHLVCVALWSDFQVQLRFLSVLLVIVSEEKCQWQQRKKAEVV